MRCVEESFILSVDSGKFRTGVLEYREREFVRSCAQAYLNDLNECVAAGTTPDDLLHMHERNSEYAEAIATSFEPTVINDATPTFNSRQPSFAIQG